MPLVRRLGRRHRTRGHPLDPARAHRRQRRRRGHAPRRQILRPTHLPHRPREAHPLPQPMPPRPRMKLLEIHLLAADAAPIDRPRRVMLDPLPPGRRRIAQHAQLIRQQRARPLIREPNAPRIHPRRIARQGSRQPSRFDSREFGEEDYTRARPPATTACDCSEESPEAGGGSWDWLRASGFRECETMRDWLIGGRCGSTRGGAPAVCPSTSSGQEAWGP